MPAYPYPHLHLNIQGDISVNQSWSFGLDFQNTNVYGPETLAPWLTAIAPLVDTWWSAAGSGRALNNTAVRYTGLSVYGYGAGVSPSIAQAEYIVPSPLAGNGSVPHPPQCSLVITKLTGTPGRKNRGRCYMPMTGIALGANMQLTLAQVTAVAAAFKTMINGIAAENLDGFPTEPIVLSQQAVAPIMSAIQVDTEIDIQRRRADKLQAASFYNLAL